LSVIVFTSSRRHTRSKRDWSSDVCSSDLKEYYGGGLIPKNTAGHFDIMIALPVKEVFENETGTGEEIAEKFREGELTTGTINLRSEERRVGKECRAKRQSNRWTKENEKRR